MLTSESMTWIRTAAGLLLLLLLGPIAVAVGGEANVARDWSQASRESANIAPDPAATPGAVVQVYAARTFGWRGAFAVHTWISIKPEGADAYTIYEVIGWRAFHGGSALQIHQGVPDRLWYGARPELLADLRGESAARAIPEIREAVKSYPWADDYRTWPGPNSNSFTAYVSRRVPALALDLPPTAIGKDYLGDTTVFAPTPSGAGFQVSVLGLLGVLVSAEEGIEINLFGLAFGIDPGDIALRLPGAGLLKL